MDPARRIASVAAVLALAACAPGSDEPAEGATPASDPVPPAPTVVPGGPGALPGEALQRGTPAWLAERERRREELRRLWYAPAHFGDCPCCVDEFGGPAPTPVF